MVNKWGFIRETSEKAKEAGLDKDTGLHRTGLEEYLYVIYPKTSPEDWIHDKTIEGFKKKTRPDYRCERLRIIVEFDGLQHYQKPGRIKEDYINQRLYEEAGYRVIRIPYFVQLTNEVIETMFGIKVQETMFDPTIPSMGIKGINTPAYCCPAGLKRMAEEFRKYPQQYEVNRKALQEADDDFLTGLSMLEEAYNNIK